MAESLRLNYLDTDEAAWIYAHHPTVGRSPDTYCPTCDKTGVYQWKGEQHKCDCELQLQLLKHYLAAGVGVPYQRLGWEDLDNNDLVDQVADYGLNSEYMRRGIGLLLVGDVGVGKTMVAMLCLKDFVKAGYNCFATPFTELVAYFSTGVAMALYTDEERRRFQHKVIGSQVLLLDDIGKEHQSASDLPESTLDYVLRTRVHHGRSTIITTNLDFFDIRPRYGDAVHSLLREKSIIIPVTDTDFRRKAHDREIDEIKAGETRPIQ